MATSTAQRLESVKIGIYIVSAIVSTALVLMTWSVSREYAEIQHRLDVRDAYFSKGLIDGAKARESALVETTRFTERIMEHCKRQPDGCNLPNDLTILPARPNFDSLEKVLTQQIKEQ